MKRARFTDERIARILQEVDQSPVSELARRHGVGAPSIYPWRKKSGDLGTDDVKLLKQFEQETNRLKNNLAESDLEIAVMKEMAEKNGRRTGAYRASSVWDGSVILPRVSGGLK